MGRKLCDVTLCPVGLVHVLQILIVPDLFCSMLALLSHLDSCLSQVRHGLRTTKCVQEKGSGQTNHRQISSRLTQPGSTSRFFQNSITAWVMTGSAGTQSYLDHCGATVIEFEGCREQWWNRVRRAIAVTVRAPRGWREDHVTQPLIVHAHTCTPRRHRRSTNTYFASRDYCK